MFLSSVIFFWTKKCEVWYKHFDGGVLAGEFFSKFVDFFRPFILDRLWIAGLQ
jgi:hypothetical protein